MKTTKEAIEFIEEFFIEYSKDDNCERCNKARKAVAILKRSNIHSKKDMIAKAIAHAPNNGLVHKTYRLGFMACYKWLFNE